MPLDLLSHAGFFWSLVQRRDDESELIISLDFLKQEWDLTTSQCSLSRMSISLPDYVYGNNVGAFSEEVGRMVMTNFSEERVIRLTVIDMDL